MLLFKLFYNEREKLLSQEYQELIKHKNEIVSEIDKIIMGPLQNSMEDQMMFLNRGIQFYQICDDIYQTIYNKKPIEKMGYYFGVIKKLKELQKAIEYEEGLEQWPH